MRISFSTESEQLDYEIAALKKASKEPAFAQYLCNVESRLIGNPDDAKALRHEMINNYNKYCERMTAAGIDVAYTFHDAVYPGMEAPLVLEPQKQPAQNTEMNNGPMNNVPPVNMADMNQQTVIPPVPAPTVMGQPGINQPVMNQQIMNQAAINQPAMNPQIMNQAAINLPAMNQQRIAQPTPNKSAATKPETSAPNKNRAEFAVGVVVLSVLGTVLILTGAIMLSVNFFDTTWQGISLYAVCVALFLFSELFIRRTVDKLSAVLTSLSIGGAFVCTLVDYFALHIYNAPVTIAILFVLSIGVGVYSYFRNSFLFSLIGYFASFTTLSLLTQCERSSEVYWILGILLASTLLWTVSPMKKNGKAFSIVQVFSHIFLTFWYTPTISGFFDNTDDWLRCFILLAASYTVLNVMVLMNGIKYYKDTDSEGRRVSGSNAVFYKIMIIVANAIYALMFVISYAAMEPENRIWGMVISGCAIIISNAIAAYVLYVKDSSLWIVCACTMAFTGTTCLGWNENRWGGLIVCIALMAGLSVLTYFKQKTAFKICDLLLKIYMFIIMFYQATECNDAPYVTKYICIVGALVAIGCATGYKLPIQIIMTFLLAWDVSQLVAIEALPVVVTGIMALAVGAFHNIKWLKSKNMYAFDIIVWIVLLIFTLLLYIPIFRDELATVTLTLILGLAIMIQYYFKRYNTFLAGKILPLGIFITIFVPIFKLENLVVSIILMCLALLCVALGFIFKQKGIRIYGLVLAMIVCAKIGFFDFWSSEILIKTIMFFVVGIIALVIAGVYIGVEKRLSKLSKVE
ncbi:MAG: hypothetical protein MJ104_08405 [Lachnospiraceae bacterium]|nr:hypothetical protein [Lachnospiraceae bacterium]